MENKEKLNSFLNELRPIVEGAKWGFMVTSVDNKPIVGQEGKVIGHKAEVNLVITVDDNGKQIKLGRRRKGE